MKRDQGLITAFVVGIAMTFVVAAGLALDGGRIVSARVEAADIAENAARVGAQQVTLVRLGWRVLDPQRAAVAAQGFLEFEGVPGEISVGIDSVTVTVTVLRAMTLLRLIGMPSRQVSVTRTAHIGAP